MSADLGVVGLAVMGQNLTLNVESRGYTAAVYNRTASKTKEFVSGTATGKEIIPSYSLPEFVASLAEPRKIILMVKAGGANRRGPGAVVPSSLSKRHRARWGKCPLLGYRKAY